MRQGRGARGAFVGRPQQKSLAYDWLGNTISSGDDANGFYDRSLGAITNAVAQGKPYQLTKASNRALAGDTARRGDLDAAYDVTGNLVAMVVRRDGPCLPTGASCWQRFAYAWDESGLLASAKRWDLTPAERTAHGPLASAPPARAPNAELRHAYGAEGERVRKTALDAAGTARHTLYIFNSLELRGTSFVDAAGDYERDGTTERPYLLVGGAPVGRIVPGDGLPSTTPGAPPHVFLTVGDHLGSTAVVVDRATSELVEQDGYQAYGGAESALRPGRWQSQREPYRFTGKEDDIEVGLQYFGARYYAPLLGRWASADPLAVHELGADPNLYAYVHGRALLAVDPNGQFAWLPFLIGIGVALAVEGVRQHGAIQRREQQGYQLGGFIVAGAAAIAGGAAGAWAGPVVGKLAGAVGGEAFGMAAGTLGGGAVGGVAGGVTSRVGIGIANGDAADVIAEKALKPESLGMDAAFGAGSAVAAAAAGQAIGKVRGYLRGGDAAVAGGKAATAPGGGGPAAVGPASPPPTSTPTTASGGAADEIETVYRGVNGNHPRFEQATQGVAVPGKQWWQVWKPTATAWEHNNVAGATLNSEYTSWTTDKRVAVNFALRAGAPGQNHGFGVVLEKSVPRSALIPSPDLKTVGLIQGGGPGGRIPESEVFLRGTVSGAHVEYQILVFP